MRSELVTNLKRRATEIIDELSEHGEPVLITQRGKPAAYLVDLKTFARMRERMRILDGVARGEKALLEGRVVSHAAAKKRMSRWLD